jgi:transcriptional regulator with XRE-family HTH domain
MNSERSEAFRAWLDKQLADNNLTENQLSVRAGLGHSTISKARKGTVPGYKTCISLAQALRVSEIEVLRLAGHLPTPPDYDPDREALYWECEQLPKYKVKMARRVMKAMSVEDEPSGKSN